VDPDEAAQGDDSGGAPTPAASAQANDQAFAQATQQNAGAAQAFNTMRSTRAFISAIRAGGQKAQNASKSTGFFNNQR
jgi:hypothetical protein